MKSKEEIEDLLWKKLQDENGKLQEALESCDEEGRPHIWYASPTEGVFEGTQISQMNRREIEDGLRIIEWRERNFEAYVRKTIVDVARDVANTMNMDAPCYSDYTPAFFGLDPYQNEYEVLGIKVDKEIGEEDRERLVQSIYEHYGYEGSYRNVYAPLVQKSKFEEIFKSAKEKYRQAMEALKGLFNKDKKKGDPGRGK